MIEPAGCNNLETTFSIEINKDSVIVQDNSSSNTTKANDETTKTNIQIEYTNKHGDESNIFTYNG